MPTWDARSVGQRAGEAGLGHTHLQRDSEAWNVEEETKDKRTLEGREASGFSATHSLSPPARRVTRQQAAPHRRAVGAIPEGALPLVTMPLPAPTEVRSDCSAADAGEKSSRGAGTSLGKAVALRAGSSGQAGRNSKTMSRAAASEGFMMPQPAVAAAAAAEQASV